MKTRVSLVLIVGLLLAADAKHEAAEKQYKALAGTWTVVAAEKDGQALERIKGGKMTIKEQGFHIVTKGGTEMKGDLRLNLEKKPKHMDFVHNQGLLRDKTWEAIYELNDDEMKICYAEADSEKERPDGFTTAQDSGRLFLVLKREKK